MDEIFHLVDSEIERAGYATKLSGGIVLAGGGAAMNGITELGRVVFRTGVRIGVPRERLAGLTDAVEAPRFSTVVGLAEYGAQRMAVGAATSARRMKISGKGLEGVVDKIKFYLQDFW
jgi:cell division protein FtsA